MSRLPGKRARPVLRLNNSNRSGRCCPRPTRLPRQPSSSMPGTTAAPPPKREIAERLTVSTRTVEGHIYRACIKLDASDRDALADLIRGGTHR